MQQKSAARDVGVEWIREGLRASMRRGLKARTPHLRNRAGERASGGQGEEAATPHLRNVHLGEARAWGNGALQPTLEDLEGELHVRINRNGPALLVQLRLCPPRHVALGRRLLPFHLALRILILSTAERAVPHHVTVRDLMHVPD
jgi:hypothetical protein